MSGRRLALLGVLTLALCTAIGMTLGGSAEAKKKQKKVKTVVFSQSLSPNLAVPDDAASGPSTPVTSAITVAGKKFKKKVVGDVDVTGIQTTGTGALAARNLRMKLIAPNGRTVSLIGRNIGATSIGPLTIDAEAPVGICDSATPTCEDPTLTLVRPFAGTANSQGLGGMGTGGVRALNGVAMSGTWTLEIYDVGNIGQTSVLNSWGLKITSAKPIT
jgi:subtilisin-like proprotein convertase family protein